MSYNSRKCSCRPSTVSSCLSFVPFNEVLSPNIMLQSPQWYWQHQQGATIGYRLDVRGIVVRFPAESEVFSTPLLPNCPDRSSVPPSLILIAYETVKQSRHKADHSQHSTARPRINGAIPPLSFMPLRSARGKIYPLQHQQSPHETSKVLHY